jgi:ribosomal protein S18 acetylase RimI-like enzyme
VTTGRDRRTIAAVSSGSGPDDAVAVDRNAARFLLDLGGAGGGDRVLFDGASAILGGSPIAYQNAVYSTQLTEDEADRVIDQVVARLDDTGLPASWHVGPRDHPADLVERLRVHGFENGGEDIGMALDLALLGSPAPLPSGVVIDEVEDEAGLVAWQSVLSDGFGEGPTEARWAASVYQRIGIGPSSAHRLVVAELDGRPAAAGAMLLDGGDVGLYFISTRPDARRRGLGAAVTRHLALMGAASGARRAVLGASEAGRRVYRRLGFLEVSRVSILEYRSARTPTSV